MYEEKQSAAVIEPTSISLLLSAANGDAEALHRVCDIYYDLVYSWCRINGAEANDAEDVTQTVFGTIRDRINKFDAKQGRFRPWLWSVTYKALVSTWRKRGLEVVNSEIVEHSSAPPSAVSEVPPRLILVRMIEAMGELLSKEDRDLLQATIVYSRPMEEVAQSLGITRNNGFVRKCRALKLLHERLAGLEDEFFAEL